MFATTVRRWLVALPFLAATAHAAVDITSATAQQNRVEGQTVGVSATVSWNDGELIPVSPFIRVTRTVRATLTPVPVVSPAVPTDITLTFDGATGSYVGTFAGLPFAQYNVRFTATQTIRRINTIPPPPPTTTSDTAFTTFRVIAPTAGCFHFNQGDNLQGWSAVGIFDGDTPNVVGAGSPFLSWQSFAGFLSTGPNDGGAFLHLMDNMLPDPAQVTTGFWRLDLRSPNLANNSAWQGVTGLSLRMTSNMGLQIQPLLFVRRPDGTTTFLRQVDAEGQPVFLPTQANYVPMVATFGSTAGFQILGVHVRIFGNELATITPDMFLMFDAVCPQR